MEVKRFLEMVCGPNDKDGQIEIRIFKNGSVVAQYWLERIDEIDLVPMPLNRDV